MTKVENSHCMYMHNFELSQTKIDCEKQIQTNQTDTDYFYYYVPTQWHGREVK